MNPTPASQSQPILVLMRIGLLALGFLLTGSSLNRTFSQPSSTFSCEVITQIPVEECETLQLLYNSLEGLNWQYQTGWLRAGQPCEWHGVTCETGPWPRSVIRISLVSNNLGGTIPGEISLLTNLQELTIVNELTEGYFNQIEGFLPSGLGDLAHLEILRIRGHNIAGPLPNQFNRLRKLKILDLSDNQLEGIIPDSLGFMTSLEELNLRNNKILGFLPRSIVNLTDLELLDLSNNELAGPIPDEIGALKKLQVLNLQSNQFSTIPPSLSELPDLFSLSLADNAFNMPPPPGLIDRLSSMSICSLENNGPNFCIPDVDLYQSEGRAELCGLPVDGTCRYCSSNNTISDASCSGLESLFYETQGLSWLNKTGWLASAYPCEWEGVECADGRVIGLLLSENNLHGQIPEELGLMRDLRTLDLSGNQLGGGVPLSVAFLETTTSSCSLANNTASLCMPDSPEYASISPEEICGIPLASSCKVTTTVGFAGIAVENDSDQSRLSWRIDRFRPGIVFEVERKVDGAFSVVQSVTGVESETAPLTYSLPLPNLEDGIHIFRIRLVDESNPALYSDEVQVVRLEERNILLETPFPNPFSARATIRFTVREQNREVTLSLYNIMGQRIKTLYAGSPTPGAIQAIDIDGTGLANGLYFVRVEGTDFREIQTLTLQK